MPVVPDALPDVAARLPGLGLLVLHGSRARGDAHPRSDWDFAFTGTGALDVDRLRIAVVDLLGTDAVDLVDLERAGALMRHRVARDGVLVYERQPGVFEAFRMDAIHTWCDLEPVLTPLYEHALKDLERTR